MENDWRDDNINMQDQNNDEKVLKLLSRTDSLLEHSIDICGKCYYSYLSAQIARDMLSIGDTGKNSLKKWSKELQKRWENSKYYVLWVEEKKAGRDPYKAFDQKGWMV